MYEMYSTYVSLHDFVAMEEHRLQSRDLDVAETVDLVMNLEAEESGEPAVLSTFAEITDFSQPDPDVYEYHYELELKVLSPTPEFDKDLQVGFKDGILTPTREKPGLTVFTPEGAARFIGGYMLKPNVEEFVKLERLRKLSERKIPQMISLTRPHVDFDNSNNSCKRGDKVKEIPTRRSRNFCDD